MKKIKVLHLNLQEIVDKGTQNRFFDSYFTCVFFTFFSLFNALDVFEMYWKNEQKCRKFTKTITHYVYFNQMIFFVYFIQSIYCICTGNYDTSTWSLSSKITVPFNTETIWGWYLLWFVHFNMGFSYVLSMVSITSYFVCCCFYISTICDHFDLHIKSADKYSDQLLKKKKQKKRKGIYRSIKNSIFQAIDIHVQVLQ